MNRRVFLKSGAMAMLSLGFAPSFLGRAAAAVQARRKLLIAIFQRGAVDGLNMIVPHGEEDYYRLRPTIAIRRAGLHGVGYARLESDPRRVAEPLPAVHIRRAQSASRRRARADDAK